MSEDTPKCTIFTGWTGPECGKDAISRNDYGGFQCQFHDELPRCEDNPIGPLEVISNDPERLRLAYLEYLREKEDPLRHNGNGKVYIPGCNAPKSMLNSAGAKKRKESQ